MAEIALKQYLHRLCGVGDFAEQCNFKKEKSISNRNPWHQVFIGFMKLPTPHRRCIQTLSYGFLHIDLYVFLHRKYFYCASKCTNLEH
jgi:hypothetical protein